MTPERLNEIIQSISKSRVLAVGDLMLDEFIWGKVSRISPEAPVPVVEVQRESCFAGGAANVARNLREFTPHAQVMGLVGDDAAGKWLRSLLTEAGIGLAGVLADESRPTILKTRIIARQQQVVRVDREHKHPLAPDLQENFLKLFAQLLEQTDAVILQDYGKGFYSQALVDQLVKLARESGTIITADVNPRNPIRWCGLDAVKPNRAEAFAAAGLPQTDPVEPAMADQALIEVGQQLRSEWDCGALLVTLGEQGMMLFDGGGEPYHTPTRAQEVFDVSGAGDTAIALFTLVLSAGGSLREAAEISNHASGVVVGKLGTATLTPLELLDSFQSHAQAQL